ncbi:hypothetical protein, partial [Mesorhizobium sp. M7A.F.Ca.US.002.01.1.1]|uniref:hypothetical protein n=1 Tax=Mesorhizobium sp. M7A.F.Ca.US.002.01.1.1 TaxID=2496700 RepID=UPI0019D4E18E
SAVISRRKASPSINSSSFREILAIYPVGLAVSAASIARFGGAGYGALKPVQDPAEFWLG